MRSSDISLAIFIVLIFIGMYVFNILAIGIKNIQDNWPEYRCEPMVMPFASMFGHSTSDNFTYCIQNMQSSFMSVLMEPVDYLTSSISTVTDGITTDIESIRTVISNIRTYITDIIESVFSVFTNIIIVFQKMIIKLKDMIAKFVGIMASMVYILQGSVMTMEANWNGPPGSLLKAASKLKL